MRPDAEATPGAVIAFSVAALMPASVQAGNNAQYLGDTIPASMIPGFTYNVAVTMKNTGTTTWTKAEAYFLKLIDRLKSRMRASEDLSLKKNSNSVMVNPTQQPTPMRRTRFYNTSGPAV